MNKVSNSVPKASHGQTVVEHMTPRARLSPELHSLARQPFLQILLLKARFVIPVTSPPSSSSEGCRCPGHQLEQIKSCFHHELRQEKSPTASGMAGHRWLCRGPLPTYKFAHIGPCCGSEPAPTAQYSGFLVSLPKPYYPFPGSGMQKAGSLAGVGHIVVLAGWWGRQTFK